MLFFCVCFLFWGMAGNAAEAGAKAFCEPWSALWEARSADLNI